MFLVVGLGNPGAEYELTRHNVGFMVADHLAQASGIKTDSKAPLYLWGKGRVRGREVVIAKPTAFMNRSGIAVAALIEDLGCATDSLIVVCDDCDLPPGKIRVRPRGGPGGQKGLESIIARIGTEEFTRVRMGIGRPASDSDQQLADYVLSPFEAEEKEGMLADEIERGVGAIEVIIDRGIEEAMNRFN